MLTNGKLTSGNRSMPSLVIDTMPSTRKLTMNIVANTGRRIDVSEIHISLPRKNRINLRARRDIAPCVGDDNVAGLQAIGNLHVRGVGEPFGHRHVTDDVAVDPENRA